MNHETIELENITKLFEFEKICREIDSCKNVESLQNMCKCYVKLYMKQQETLINIGKNFNSI